MSEKTKSIINGELPEGFTGNNFNELSPILKVVTRYIILFTKKIEIISR